MIADTDATDATAIHFGFTATAATMVHFDARAIARLTGRRRWACERQLEAIWRREQRGQRTETLRRRLFTAVRRRRA